MGNVEKSIPRNPTLLENILNNKTAHNKENPPIRMEYAAIEQSTELYPKVHINNIIPTPINELYIVVATDAALVEILLELVYVLSILFSNILFYFSFCVVWFILFFSVRRLVFANLALLIIKEGSILNN